MRKTELIITVEQQKDILKIKLDAGFITKEEYDKEILTLKEYSVGCLVG